MTISDEEDFLKYNVLEVHLISARVVTNRPRRSALQEQVELQYYWIIVLGYFVFYDVEINCLLGFPWSEQLFITLLTATWPWKIPVTNISELKFDTTVQ